MFGLLKNLPGGIPKNISNKTNYVEQLTPMLDKLGLSEPALNEFPTCKLKTCKYDSSNDKYSCNERFDENNNNRYETLYDPNKENDQDIRIPSYCDRILYNKNNGAEIQPLYYVTYNKGPIGYSDHNAIYGDFTISF